MTIQRALKKNSLSPHLSQYWKIPKEQDAEFVARMEDVLDVYRRPYDPARPMVCMDESCFQMVGEVRDPIPMEPGRPLKIDDEYVRMGVAEIFLAVEPLAGRRITKVTEHRASLDWAYFMREISDDWFPNAETIVLVMDNLNTHSISSLYKAFPPAEARRLAQRFEIHYTPKHGSWLNISEIELSVLKRQCLKRRIATIEEVRSEITAWCTDRNNRDSKIDWQFNTDTARVKLKHLYPDLG